MKIRNLLRNLFLSREVTVTLSEREAYLIRAAEAERHGQITPWGDESENLPPTGLEPSIQDPKTGRFKSISNQSGISMAVDEINKRLNENDLLQQRENREG